MSKFRNIGIIGAGAIGNAMGKRLASQHTTVNYWDITRELSTVPSLDALVSQSDLILICTPSRTNRILAQEILQASSASSRPAVLSLAKGVEPGFHTVDHVLRDVLDPHFITGALSGPMIAAELSAGESSGVVVATTNQTATMAAAALLQTAGFTVETSADIASVTFCGAVKNVYALALGLADGLSLGFNTKSTIAVFAISEMAELLRYLRLDPQSAYGLAGLGDLLTTGFSGASYNWKVGRMHASGQPQQKGEGMNTLEQLVTLVPSEHFPLLHTLKAIFLNNADPGILKALLHSHVTTKNDLNAPK